MLWKLYSLYTVAYCAARSHISGRDKFGAAHYRHPVFGLNFRKLLDRANSTNGFKDLKGFKLFKFASLFIFIWIGTIL
jgi:hypothetical protein